MQWDASPNAGFTTPEATPWLPLAADYATRNVAAQENDPTSLLSLYRALAALRRAEPALNRGEIEVIDVGVEGVLAYRRMAAGSDSFLVVLNLGGKSHELELGNVLGDVPAKSVFSTHATNGDFSPATFLHLSKDEGVILRISS